MSDTKPDEATRKGSKVKFKNDQGEDAGSEVFMAFRLESWVDPLDEKEVAALKKRGLRRVK